MFGDDPDTAVMTVWVGSGTISDAHVRGSMHCAKRVSDHAVASDNSGSEEGKEHGLGGLWRDCEGEKREREGPTSVSGDRKRPTLDRLYYRYSLTVGLSTELRMR